MVLFAACRFGELRQAQQLRGEGNDLVRQGQAQLGYERLLEALAAVRSASAGTRFDYRAEVARVLVDAGSAAAAAGRMARAVEHLEEATGYARLVGEDGLEAEARARRASIALADGRLEEAVEHYRASARLFARAGDVGGRAESLTNLGVALTRLGHWHEAARALDQGRQLAFEVGDGAIEALALNNRAALHGMLGEIERARRGYLAALAVARRSQSRLEEAFALNNLGLLAADEARFGEAQRLYREALERKAAEGDSLGQASTTANLSDLYLTLGQLDAARDALEDSLGHARRSRDRRAVAHALLRLGQLEELTGDPERAAGHYDEARRLAEAVRDGRKAIEATLRKAQLMRLMARARDDRAAFERSLLLLEQVAGQADAQGARTLALPALLDLCAAALADGQEQARAHRICPVAIRRALDSADPLWRFQGHRLQARLLEVDKKPVLAIAAYTRARKALEALRAGAGTERFKEGLFAERLDVFDALVRLHAERDVAAAFAEAERARARGLLDLLGEAKVDRLRGVPLGLLERERRARAAVRLAQQRASSASDAEAPATDRALRAALGELDFVRGELRRASPRAVGLDLDPVDLAAVQASLEPGDLLLEYFVSTKMAYLWAVTRTGARLHVLPDAPLLTTLSRLFTVLAAGSATDQQSQADLGDLGHRLYRKLIAPVGEPQLAAVRRLIIAPHRNLAYVPFAALLTQPHVRSAPWPVQPFLIRRFQVVTVPSASVFVELRRARDAATRGRLERTLKDAKDLLAVGDPAMGGEGGVSGTLRRARRVRAGRNGAIAWPPHEQLAPLPYTRTEVSDIARLFLPAQRDVLLAASATLQKTKERLTRARHRYIHFATHGLVDEQHPELSGLVLTPDARDEGFLPLLEIYNLQLDAELVVLSACQTAVGREVAGEGLLGLARGFLHAGARGVVASLWPVPDESTSALMARFYRHLRNGQPGDGALRAAQLELIADGRYAAPRQWAAFALIGR